MSNPQQDRPDTSDQGGPGIWIAAAILIGVGVVFLLQNMGYAIPGNWWALFLLIPAGFALAGAWKSYRAERQPLRAGHGRVADHGAGADRADAGVSLRPRRQLERDLAGAADHHRARHPGAGLLAELTGQSVRVDLFDFDLPEERIALRPARPRDAARLLVVKPGEGLDDRHVRDLPDLLAPGDVLVLNDTKVIPAELHGERLRGESATPVSVTLFERVDAVALAGLRPARHGASRRATGSASARRRKGPAWSPGSTRRWKRKARRARC